MEVIPWRAIRQGRRLGQGSEGAVLEAVYRDAPVVVKEGVSEAEIDMFLSAGTHDNLVGLRGLTQKVWLESHGLPAQGRTVERLCLCVCRV